MSIGVFDSGVGGLSIHRALVERLPGADFVYLADQKNQPYGGRPGEEIVDLTQTQVGRLFDEGCSLVVLACNTASAIALRRLQQTWLPGERQQRGRPVNILGIIVPTIEAATGQPWTEAAQRPPEDPYGRIEIVERLGVFCTPATAASRVYEIEIDKRRDDVAVFVEPCPSLARLVELGAPRDELAGSIERHVAHLSRTIGRPPDRAILGCTHYELVAGLFREALPQSCALIHQPPATAAALAAYLAAHPEYDPGQGGGRRFLTTGEPGPQSDLVEAFWGGPLSFEAA